MSWFYQWLIDAFVTALAPQFAAQQARFDKIDASTAAINKQGATIMATEQNLQDDLDTIKTGVAGLATSFSSLQALIAGLQANQPVTQAQLDAMTSEAEDIKTALGQIGTPTV